MHVVFVFVRVEKGFNSGIGALSGYLKLHGHTTQLLAVDESQGEEEFKKALLEMDPAPGLAAFTLMTFQWKRAKSLSQWVKEALDIPVICGGYHPTLIPEEVIQHPHVDAICRGEGELALLQAVEGLQKNKDVSEVKGLWVKGKSPFTPREGIFRNPPAPLIPDLDMLPYWDREIFPFDFFYNEFGEITFLQTKYTMPVAAGRGCPHNCTFCCNEFLRKLHRPSGGPFIRRRSVSSLMGELKYLATNYPIKAFEFWDEQFETNLQWLEEFTEVYRNELNFPFFMGMRPENAKPHILSLLKQANCRLIGFGVEAGNEKYRNKYLEKRNTNEEIIQGFQNTKNMGISTVSFNMLGLPDETYELAMETLELNRKIEPDHLMCHVFQPFPGTRLYDLCVEKGYIKSEDLDYMYHHGHYSLKQPTMSEEEFSKLYKNWDVFEKEMIQEREKTPKS